MSEDFPTQDSPAEEPTVSDESTEETPAAETTETSKATEPAEVTEDTEAEAEEATTDGPETPITALLRRARDAYNEATRSALAAAGLDDVPKNGTDVLEGLRKQGDAASSGLAALLGTSKQAVSQLIDTLELRGYLDRHIDPEDRRKLVVTLTERGQHAAEVIEEAAQKIDTELTARLGEDAMAPLHKALAALGEIRLTPKSGETATDEAASEPVTEATAEDVIDEEPATEAGVTEAPAEPAAEAETTPGPATEGEGEQA